MSRGELYLGLDTDNLQLLTPFGRTFNVRNIEQSRRVRTATKKLKRDRTAIKKEFTLSYSLIGGDDLAVYENLYEQNKNLVFRYYKDDTTYTDYTVLANPIEWERVLFFDDGLYGDVEFFLEEV